MFLCEKRTDNRLYSHVLNLSSSVVDDNTIFILQKILFQKILRYENSILVGKNVASIRLFYYCLYLI